MPRRSVFNSYKIMEVLVCIALSSFPIMFSYYEMFKGGKNCVLSFWDKNVVVYRSQQSGIAVHRKVER